VRGSSIGYHAGMKLMTTLAKLARSRHGRRLTQQAINYAKSPEGKRKIADARRQLAARRKPKPR
jgi:hypothetical protein